jgi:hypothetical protein
VWSRVQLTSTVGYRLNANYRYYSYLAYAILYVNLLYHFWNIIRIFIGQFIYYGIAMHRSTKRRLEINMVEYQKVRDKSCISPKIEADQNQQSPMSPNRRVLSIRGMTLEIKTDSLISQKRTTFTPNSRSNDNLEEQPSGVRLGSMIKLPDKDEFESFSWKTCASKKFNR